MKTDKEIVLFANNVTKQLMAMGFTAVDGFAVLGCIRCNLDRSVARNLKLQMLVKPKVKR